VQQIAGRQAQTQQIKQENKNQNLNHHSDKVKKILEFNKSVPDDPDFY
jgi:hypothetical protein